MDSHRHTLADLAAGALLCTCGVCALTYLMRLGVYVCVGLLCQPHDDASWHACRGQH